MSEERALHQERDSGAAGHSDKPQPHWGRRSSDQFDPAALSAGGSEMGARVRDFDWSTTPIGPIESWPPTLQTVVRLLLANPYPSLLWWGPEYISIYNDTYATILGTKHPRALGQPCSECWKEIWHVLQPLIDTPFGGGQATWIEDFVLELHRHGFLEECHFTVSYSAVPDDAAPTGIGGVLATVHEITDRVLAERRVGMLRDLGTRVGEAKTADEACVIAAETLAAQAQDVPFALFYLIDASGTRAHLAGAAGVAAGRDISPLLVEIDEASGATWPFFEAIRTQTIELVPNLQGRFTAVPPGPWSDPPHTGAVFAIPSNRPGVPVAILAVGLSARLKFDEHYRNFLELLRTQVATAIANARAYEEERKRAEALAEIDRAKTAFFSNISHEFRTPLTLMLGPTDDLLAGAQGELTPAQRAQLELVRRNELRLQRLVNALLDFSRIEAGRAQASYEPVDLSILTRDVASAFRSAIERAGLTFSIECPPLGESIFVDKNMWEQIVLNLLSNALKFTFDGGIGVSLRLAEESVELIVTDSGVGVRAEDLPRLFERFHRVEGSRARTHEGSGIGLALTQELVRLHGGAIHAKSRYGVGTSFSVTIPRGLAHLPSERIRAADRLASTSAAADPFVQEALRWLPQETSADPLLRMDPSEPERTILVADDNADMRDYLRRVLGEKWTVETVNDGSAALEVARTRPPDLIVADVMMPGLDGFRLLRELKAGKATAAIPFILLSARAGEESRVEGLQAGADDYLVKPFSARELVARVSTHLLRARLHDDIRVQQTELLALIVQAPLPICVLRGEGLEIEMANQPFLDLAGRSGSAVGMTLSEAFPELGDQGTGGRTFAGILRHVMATGETFIAHEVPIRLERSGVLTTGFYNAACARIQSGDGRIDRVMALGTEVTGQVLARRRAEEAERQIKDALELRSEFLTGAAHELRTPLTTLGLQADGLLHLLRHAPAGDETAERCLPRAEKLREQADRLAHLIEGMIDAFGLHREALEFVRTEMDLDELARTVVSRLRKESKRVTIDLRARSSIGRWDRNRLEQILMHLLSNAIKFGSGQPIEVVVDDTPACARIIVKDRGIGIAAEDQERIFNRFVRLAPTTQFGGFGLGLWVVRELVQAMGGSVRVESQPGVGASFIVELPKES